MFVIIRIIAVVNYLLNQAYKKGMTITIEIDIKTWFYAGISAEMYDNSFDTFFDATFLRNVRKRLF